MLNLMHTLQITLQININYVPTRGVMRKRPAFKKRWRERKELDRQPSKSLNIRVYLVALRSMIKERNIQNFSNAMPFASLKTLYLHRWR